jgi:hypothetical protein
MASKKVVIVGVGALGSHVAQFLRNDAELKVIDFDRVEQKNILAQFFSKPSVGKNKAQSLKDMFAFLYGIKVEAVGHRLTVDNATLLLDDADVVINCVDNIETRQLIKHHTERLWPIRPCLHGAVDAVGSFGRVCWDQHFIPDAETPGAATCQDGEHLPFIAMVSAVMAKAVQQFLKTGEQYGYSVLPGGTVLHTRYAKQKT